MTKTSEDHMPESLFPGLTRVKARKALWQGDESVPEGALGTIVHVYDDGDAFEVEFASPSGTVLLVHRADIEAA